MVLMKKLGLSAKTAVLVEVSFKELLATSGSK
jgi:hypothetical protein